MIINIMFGSLLAFTEIWGCFASVMTLALLFSVELVQQIQEIIQNHLNEIVCLAISETQK